MSIEKYKDDECQDRFTTAYSNIQLPTLRMAALEFKEVMTHTISKLLIPLLPLYIEVY